MISFEEAGYEAKLSEVIDRLFEKKSVRIAPVLSLWCGTDNFIDECFPSNHLYLAKDIDFEVCLSHYAGQHRIFFVEWLIIEV